MDYAPYIVSVVMIALGVIVWFMVRNWAKGWETRLAAQDRRLDRHTDRHNEHDVKHATLATHLEHIKETVDKTSENVEKILSNGKRTSRG